MTMTDLEITKLCAEAMGYHSFTSPQTGELIFQQDKPQAIVQFSYDPLHDDAQVMALEDWLVERGVLQYGKHWLMFWLGGDSYHEFLFPLDGSKERRRHAICECVVEVFGQRIAT